MALAKILSKHTPFPKVLFGIVQGYSSCGCGDEVCKTSARPVCEYSDCTRHVRYDRTACLQHASCDRCERSCLYRRCATCLKSEKVSRHSIKIGELLHASQNDPRTSRQWIPIWGVNPRLVHSWVSYTFPEDRGALQNKILSEKSSFHLQLIPGIDKLQGELTTMIDKIIHNQNLVDRVRLIKRGEWKRTQAAYRHKRRNQPRHNKKSNRR